MKKNNSSRIIKEHGLISNILSGLYLVDTLVIANICRRSYNITVPWNTYCKRTVTLVSDAFPKIDDDIPKEFVCKRVKDVSIENELGVFYGAVCK